jgi:hypothetical protein
VIERGERAEVSCGAVVVVVVVASAGAGAGAVVLVQREARVILMYCVDM